MRTEPAAVLGVTDKDAGIMESGWLFTSSLNRAIRER